MDLTWGKAPGSAFRRGLGWPQPLAGAPSHFLSRRRVANFPESAVWSLKSLPIGKKSIRLEAVAISEQ
jgi:hypothetical protein